MIPRHRRHAAWRQAALLAAILLGAGAGAAVYEHRPAHEDELAIPIGELRSQGFELEVLNQQAAGRNDRLFVTAHARQLAQSIERARAELSGIEATARLAPTRAAALQRSAPLADAAAQLGAGHAPLAPASAAHVVAAARQLKALEDALQR